MGPAAVLDKQIQDPLDSYEVQANARIRRFLDDHSGLDSVLLQAPVQIKKAFRREPLLRLALYQHRDAQSSPELHLIIATSIDNDTEWDAAESSLRCLHENWLKALPRELTKNLLVRVEPA